MHLKAKSKLLHRVNNETTYSIQYHDTVVLEVNKKARILRLKTGGWETMNTAKAMTIGLEEAGINAHVEHRDNKKEQGLFLCIDGHRTKLSNNTEINL